jgi:hypothetical protein
MNENPYENYKFIDFSYAHIVGEPIKFILEKIRDDNCNSYNVTITDENETFVWGRGADISCDSDNISNPVMYQTKIGYNKDHPIIINNSGKYYLEIESADALIKQEFVVRQNHSGISLDRTVYPTPNPDPLDLWNSADVIIDGTVIEVEYTNSDHGNNVASYHIKANKYFKGVHEMGLLFAQNDLHVSEFDVNDNGLFYLKSDNPFGYVVQSYSVKTFGNCNARDLIEISPVLPHEGFSLSAPTLSESYFDPCVANYFTYDPDFFSGILDRISPLKQAKHGISNDLIRCYDDLILVHKYDDSTACVENETKKVLVERGWAKPDIRASTE